MFKRFALGLLGSLVLIGPAFAALPAADRQPYKLTVVLRVAKHQLLTEVFKEQLGRELRDSLRDAFAGLAEVNVVEQHPWLEDVEKRGLQQALDNVKDAEPIKTHFVLVDYVDGQYEIQSRQHDGLTGLSSPVVRKVRLADPAGRSLVARTAALLIDRDFGLVGVVGDARNPRQVRVTLNGGKLAPLGSRVQKDEVFAIVQVNRLGGSQPVREALLQVVEPPNADGVCICRLLARFADPASQLAAGSGVLGYRCMKLGTGDGPLRLRLVNDQGLPHFNLQVQGSKDGFEPGARQADQGFTNREGFLQTRDKFAHVACLTVVHGGNAVARLPVPILEDQLVVQSVNANPDAAPLGEVLFLRDRHIRQLDEALQLQVDLGQTLQQLLAKADHPGALEAARRGKARLEADLKELKADHDGLAGAAVKAKLNATQVNNLLADGGRRQVLENSHQELTDFIAGWSKRMDSEARQKERDALVDRARLLRNREARYDEALALYREALSKGDTPQLQKEHRELEEAWAKRHPPAQKFFYEVWPNLNSSEKILAHLDDARKHFEECKKTGDKLTPRKLLLAGLLQTKVLEKERSKLSSDREDDRQPLERIKTVAEGLQKLHEEVNAFLAGK
ncbi:MAG: hypothetical protein JNM56_11105 [Planctomycetia bacterium]|nr:hypothetical protein [Planctomycetia bacterium]